MPHRTLRLCLLVLCALAVLAPARRAHAQSDSQLWLEGGVAHDVGKVTLSFDQHLRFDDGMSRIGSIMPEPGISVRVKRWLRLGASYRLQYERNRDGVFETRHRLNGYGRARADLGKLRLEYRLQLQEQVRPDDNELYRHGLRNRATLSYRGKPPWTPSGELELHHDLDNGDAIHLDKIWLTVGVQRELGRYDVELYYRAELPQARTTDPTLHILGLGFHAEL
ncbi:MAG: DUF2490 domain-containing protein [Myxococcales bacterium]|nr:DUF2490 domain-containing protein [Myxococcales bacterium]